MKWGKLFQIFATPVKFIENYPLMVITCLLIMLGVSGAWLSLPLSGEKSLVELHSSAINAQIKLLVMSFLAFYCLATHFRLGLIRVIFSVGLVCLLFYVALNISFFDGQNVGQYINESQSFREVQHVLALNYIPNSGRSVETLLAFDAFRISERLNVSVGLLAWGAKLSLICAILLFLFAVLRCQKTILATTLSAVLFSLFLMVSGVSNVSLAYLKLNQGIRDFNQNRTIDAIKQLNEAVLMDPVLAYSIGFPLLSSYVYFNAFGPEHKYSYAYRMNQYFAAGNFNEVFALNSFVQQRELNDDVVVNLFKQNELNSFAIKRLEHKLLSDAYNRVGLLSLRREHWALAEQSFQIAALINQSVVAKMALLSIYAETKQYDTCNLMAENLLGHIKNSSVLADIWTTKGDCLSAIGNEVEARTAYENSIQLDADKNYRAVKGLSGT